MAGGSSQVRVLNITEYMTASVDGEAKNVIQNFKFIHGRMPQ